MASKRSPPKDLNLPPVQLKQPRLEMKSHFVSKPIGLSQQFNKIMPLPATELSPPLPVPTSTSQRGLNVAPSFVLPISVKPAPQTQFACGGPLRPTLVSPTVVTTVVGCSPIVAVNSNTVVSPAMLLSPPPSYLTTSPVLSTNDEDPSQTTSESDLQSFPELTCSSPSQFLHPPTSVYVPSPSSSMSAAVISSSAVTSLSTSVNRQPICSSGNKIENVGSDVDNRMMKLKVLKYHRAKLASLKLKHEVELKEKFFLETRGNMMDIISWKKRPNSRRDKYLKFHDIDSSTIPYDEVLSPDFHKQGIWTSQPGDEEVKLKKQSALKSETESKPLELQKPTTSKPEPEETLITSTTIQIPLSTVSPSIRGGTPSSPIKTPQLLTSSPRHVTCLHSTYTFSSICESSHEDIVMRARHEAEVMRAIADLRKEGLWSSSRLPKVQEPHRRKMHWDYLLEEMQWLATDFANERRWKINAAKKISRSVSGYFRELEMQQVRTEKEESLKLRKIASSIAKEMKHFWDSIQKVVEHKQQLLLEEKRKKAMDMHLEFIVDQTAKYSSWLVKGLTTVSPTETPSEFSLRSVSAVVDDSDAFLTPEEVSDDEETIEKEELQMAQEGGKPSYDTEIQTLQKEGEMPLEELLASLPPAYLPENTKTTGLKERVLGREEVAIHVSSDDTCKGRKSSHAEEDGNVLEAEDIPRPRHRSSPPKFGSAIMDSASNTNLMEVDKADGECDKDAEACNNSEYDASEEGDEDESTIAEQELHESEVDHADELNTLLKEGDLPLEDLLKMYNLESRYVLAGSDKRGETSNKEVDEERKRKWSVSLQESGDEGTSSSTEEEEIRDGEEEVDGLEFLVSGKSIEEVCQTEAGFSDVAAVAEQFQPKGITLATTEVKTNIPFLVKHKLREYQHIGLDWLVAMHVKRLNGILADEMGLGKTIQTIALLAHLACEKGNWGPHLIVVPTSVMLNWEYELKKWCPAFKILTYFGSYKERKQKRIGWTKLNAFHVCITSYNIAVTDHRAFKQMKWKYLILDEAQNIKNFKSQRWQTLLTFNSQRRLLLTGTPLQNNLMELWSLMHFLMPKVFSSHSDFREWFSNPLTGMVEGSQEYNDSIVKRLHQVLRPFLLRRLKMEVEKQMPRKYEHVIMCRLSKRQRFLYDEYMSRRKTKDTLAAGNYLSVINILMQLRKVCNHPDLFEPRPILSPLRLSALESYIPSILLTVFQQDPFKNVSLDHFNLGLASCELDVEAFAAYRSRQLQAPKTLIVDSTRSQVEVGEDVDVDEQERNKNSFLEDLHLPDLACNRQKWTLSRRKNMHEINSRRCRRIPMYGTDLVKSVRLMCSSSESSSSQTKSSTTCCTHWLWSGYVACSRRNPSWEGHSSALQTLLPSYEVRSVELEDILKRFIITVPPATAPSITLVTYLHTPKSHIHELQHVEQIATHLTSRSSVLHCAATCMCLQFPETRLIQYDCGKLQTLDILLRDLKVGNHRVLIFTQMARVLDILEIFLNYHGHTYLRLDGATPVQRRQALMDRFNRDERIFCFILSTRSGGLGVNLTGADTVVFYDSDWNPTMDAQAQDRCHRIGQTRDVHIYRLVCESTVEENILKKANQKRMLGDIAIEGGVFTTDFFKEATLRDIFKATPDELPTDQIQDSAVEQQTKSISFSSKQIEYLLMQAEDESDAQAASKAKAEQVAEKAEFDDGFCIQLGTEQTSETHLYIEHDSKALDEFAVIQDQLSGVERYALRYLEKVNAAFTAEQLKIAEESIEQAKRSWELSHLQSLREEEERIAEANDNDEVLLTYDRPEIANKVFIDKVGGEVMPAWLPPTPPADDADADNFYIDIVLDMAYDTSCNISPAQLASIAPFSDEDYDVLGLSRHAEAEPIKKSQKLSSKQNLKEHVNVPPSLFWRRYATDTLSTKLKKLASHQKKLKTKDQFTPLLEQQPEGPDWSHFEDWLLLKGITDVLEFPLSLAITVPAQMPNWSIIADLISLLSKVRRSPLQCREHLMNVIIPREDNAAKGDDSFEPKKHKSKDNVFKKSRNKKEQKTKQIVIGGSCKELSRLFITSFDMILDATLKRKQTSKFILESVQKPSTHADLLKDYGVQMESVLSPMQVAYHRAERIHSEIPRHSSQVHQLLAQPYHFSLMRGYAAAAAAAGTPFVKQSATGYTLPRQVPASIAISSVPAPRFQPVSSAGTSFTSSQLPQITSTAIPSPGVLPTVSQSTPTPTTTIQPSISTSLISSKGFGVTTNVSDISKTLRGNITHQQLLLLRQSTLQQQANANRQPSSTQLGRPLVPQQQTTPSVQVQSNTVTPKVALHSGIEQLRGSIALPAQQRFSPITSVSGNTTGRGLPAGRTLQTEDVLALLKQQSLRIAATQSYKSGHAVSPQLHPQTHLQFRTEPVHLPTKVQPLPTTVVPVDAIKLVSTPTTPVTDAIPSALKVDTMELNQSAKQPKLQSQSLSVSTPLLGAHQTSGSVHTTAAQTLVKGQKQGPAQQPPVKTPQGTQLPSSTV